MSVPTDDTPLLAVAGSVADGAAVDWRSADTLAHSRGHQDLLAQLKVISNLAEAHRSAADAAEPVDLSEVTLPPGSMWGPLRLEREIGRGRFGAVYVAWDPALEREVALKLLSARGDTAAVIQEGRMIARVRHPNIVAVHGIDRFDGIVGLWMELVDGLTIKQVLSAKGVMGSREAALIGIDLSRALAAVHRAGLLHRDIKTQNVMRESGGRIVLMDFGAGEIRAESPAIRRLTGTPGYLAPEVFAGEPATIASDIYSLGVFLYHVLTMRYPVEGQTFEELERAHAENATVPLADRRPELPGAIIRVVERALSIDPARRYRSAGAMQQDLMAALNEEINVDAAPPRMSVGAQRSSPPSVAVLPFENLGPDRDIEYFCSGLAEELLTGLGKVEGLRVASRTSSLAVRQTDNTDIRSICRRLGVDTVLEGTVRKAGERLRITAQLVSAADGCHLWSEGYDRQMSDVFAVQDEIAQSVVDRLKLRLNELSPRPLIKRYTDNPRAYQLYLRGRFFWARRYQGGLGIALREFARAIEEDAGYALAHAGLADANAFLGFYSLRHPRTAFAEARAAAERALAIDADLPEAHTSIALVKVGDEWDWPGAEKAFRRAIELDSTQALARIYLSWLMVVEGDVGGGIAEARKAQETEPMSPLVNSGIGHTYFLARRYDEAIAECLKAFEVDPSSIVATYVVGACRAMQSRLAEAIELMERAAAMSDRAPFYLALLGNLYARAGAGDKARGLLDELKGMTSQRYVPPHSQAFIYAGLGDLERAFEWQARAFADGASPFNYLSPVIENMHADPRHLAEMRRMGWRY
ncbi:MAG TPA: protein kinase [Vicinamibacterales bacterium]|nr:protein kinase [Vicinamibacterales bacterium]